MEAKQRDKSLTELPKGQRGNPLFSTSADASVSEGEEESGTLFDSPPFTTLG